MSIQTPATLTYGDTFTLPSVTHANTGEPVMFLICDTRDAETAGESYEARARFMPTQPGEADKRLSTLHAVKIGRTERAAEAISSITARAHSAYKNGIEISSYDASLTEKMHDVLSSELGALNFSLPAYTVEELRRELIEEATRHGETLGRLHHGNRAAWDNYQQDERARALRGEALNAETRSAMHAAMCAAFAKAAASALRIPAHATESE